MGYDARLNSKDGIDSKEFDRYIKNKYEYIEVKLLEDFGCTSMSYSYFIQLDKYISCNTEFLIFISKDEYQNNCIKKIDIRAQIWVNTFVCNVVYNLIAEIVNKFAVEIEFSEFSYDMNVGERVSNRELLYNVNDSFHNSFTAISTMIENIPVNTGIDVSIDSLEGTLQNHGEEMTIRPSTMFANSILINCVSLIESLLRKYYIVLLKLYPGNIDTLLSTQMNIKNYLKKRKDYDSDIMLIADMLNFQNIDAIIKNFENFQDVEIKEFFKQNNNKFYRYLDKTFKQRHEYVHSFKINKDYKLEEIKMDYEKLVQFNDEFYEWLNCRVDDNICDTKVD